MTPEDITADIDEIEDSRFDPEAAHSLEDNLYKRVLSAIAVGACEDPARCAAEALKAKDLTFPRHCS